MHWIPIDEQKMPLETDIIVMHPYGVEAIHFFNARWTYWYKKDAVPESLMRTITHWCKPDHRK